MTTDNDDFDQDEWEEGHRQAYDCPCCGALDEEDCCCEDEDEYGD